MANWLMKSEPDEVSIEDALNARNQTVSWTGVRNYQARNFIRDRMQIGDRVLFYHSSCAVPGVAGLAKVVSHAYPDPTQFDSTNPYFDAKASAAEPRWVSVDVKALQAFPVIGLAELRANPKLSEMRLLARGNRLSVMPVSDDEFTAVVAMRPALVA